MSCLAGGGRERPGTAALGAGALVGRPSELFHQQPEDRRRHRVAGANVEGFAHLLAQRGDGDALVLQHDRERDAEVGDERLHVRA